MDGKADDITEDKIDRKKTHGERISRAEPGNGQDGVQQIGQVRGQEGYDEGTSAPGYSGVQAGSNGRVRLKAGEGRKKNRARLAE